MKTILSPEQVRAKFEKEIPAFNEIDILDWVLKFAADVQAPPTGDDVAFAAALLNDAVDDLRRGCLDTRENLAAEVGRLISEYGAACYAQGRSEAENDAQAPDVNHFNPAVIP